MSATAMSLRAIRGVRMGSSAAPITVLQLRSKHSVPSWATVDPDAICAASPGIGKNLCGGEWSDAAKTMDIIDPLNGEVMIKVPDTSAEEAAPYIQRMKSCPRSGLHNPIKNPERYNMLGEVCAKAAEEMRKPEVAYFYARLIQRLTPKSWAQANGEPTITRKFLENYSCDQVRYLAKSFGVSGDHAGQTSCGYRMPFGGCGVVTPFNFPLEIPALQTLSGVFMGNQITTKVDEKVQLCMEQFIRMLHHVGLPKTDIDLIYCKGPVMNKILVDGQSRMLLFTGSQHIAEKLCSDLKGRVKLEDAGFDWKVLGPDPSDVEYVAWQADQDAYAFSGQKCSAQSMLFVHENWNKIGIVEKLAEAASKRNLNDLTIGPVLTWSTEKFMAHVDACLKIPGAKVAFGAKPLTGHTIPKVYGAVEPTAVRVPIESLKDPECFKVATTELFGPFQVIVDWKEGQLPLVLECLNNMENHLTAGVVSNDVRFLHEVLGNTISGTTYAGMRAKTTAAPQQHWFGPSGDPRAGGIHTPEAIKLVWSSHREIIYDYGPVAENWKPVQS
mmetsp:Transcript_57659/g.122656  ORF Transcript_57659/g.122656 Transcript_57659/m.122656 type:complete len:555 (-) Transcript_57659:366-2030(-)|eukprot:CAMPEP_0206446932 /NCGR_PEP_ID=MMETSP0324_2-20121206/16460_1 /ASSEMBLY_ACC=CAM_ASM_000836 /TAXON_ID=2866 /ORGANISM="Crypthecodinium cohnii, Strain Seligo" /LENGTH=554 /DNA_ID=CAMNT_0053915557 /DNA_START=86 /DNA_END=1750 /DNA_ORIENTATION=+